MAEPNPQSFLIVRQGQIGRDAGNPAVAAVRLSAAAEGPHLDFVADAPTLERIARMLQQAATDIRERSN